MPLPALTELQTSLLTSLKAASPAQRKHVFLDGPAGCGKTTTGAAHLASLLASGTPGGSILVLLPQRTLAAPYQDSLRGVTGLTGTFPSIITLGGLARRMVDLFWPVVAEAAGFTEPHRPPVFLTLETAQYFMARALAPYLEQGYFESLAIDRNRLYSQILDNLNKAALVGFPIESYSEKLKAAWVGPEAQGRLYDQAQECALAFRTECLKNNRLDFSLQLEVFIKQVWPLPLARRLLTETYHHLVYDNLEEDTPVAHDLLLDWLPSFDSALLIQDRDGGFRSFLGADPVSAQRLREACNGSLIFDHSFTTPPELTAWAGVMAGRLTGVQPAAPAPDARAALIATSHRFQPESIVWTAAEIERLIREEQQAPGGIAILAPILSDTLRFLVVEELARRGIPTRSHRPSRSLREEPAAECLLTLAQLAHPAWNLRPTEFEMQKCLVQSLSGLDAVRAHLMTKIVFHNTKSGLSLSLFADINPELRERITYQAGNSFDRLKTWLEQYQAGPADPLDHFLSRLFGEVLSQPGFGFHHDPEAGATAAHLVESVRKFRSVLEPAPGDAFDLGAEYTSMVRQGVLAAQYLSGWDEPEEDAVWISPAYTFLMRNRPVDVQFWLDVGNAAWWERLYQPLTHPYVLSRNWPTGAPWSTQAEIESGQASLARLVTGMVRRCRHKVYINYSELSGQGFDQRSPFLRAIQYSLRSQNTREAA